MAAQSGEKTVKRGELIFKEGELIEKAYLIKSGRVSLFVERNGKKIELFTANKSQILGEESLFTNAKFMTSAEAAGPVTYIELPISVLKVQVANVSPGVKVLLKSQVDELKNLRTQMKQYKMESDPNPMPEKLVPRVFASISLTGKHVGRNLFEIKAEEEQNKSAFQKAQDDKDVVEVSHFESDQSVKIAWNALKLYSTRFFMESHKRVEQALQIMTKLNWVEMLYSENDEGEKELKDIIIHRLQFVEEFAEFFQYHLYKGGRSEMIHVDKLALQVAEAVVGVSQGVEPDFRGNTVIDYNTMCENIKEKYKFEFKSSHINALERKGLFARRQSKEDVVSFAFDFEEFSKTSQYWRLLSEIEKLNTVGFVDFTVEKEKEEVSNACPSCKSPFTDDQKFCGECGHSLAA